MAKLVVTVICSVGVAIATLIIVFGRSRRGFRSTADGLAVWGRAREGLRQACAGLAAGIVGGILGFGMGGRLMMRVLAATSPGATGRTTDADEIVGEVSAGGSIFFILFVGTFGVIGSMVYVLARRWLPNRTLVAGAVGAGIGGGLLARPSAVLDPDNPDFAILEPTWLAALLCMAVIVVGALTIAVLVDVWVPRWPAPSLSVTGIAGLLPLLVCAFPPFAGLALLVLLTRAMRIPTSATTVRRVGRWVVALGAGVGGAWVALSGLAILF